MIIKLNNQNKQFSPRCQTCYLFGQRIALYEGIFDTPKHWSNLPFSLERLEQLVSEGKVIPCRVDSIYSRIPTKRAYMFTKDAQEEWEAILESRIRVHDFSEEI